jgi:hypothetical protein
MLARLKSVKQGRQEGSVSRWLGLVKVYPGIHSIYRLVGRQGLLPGAVQRAVDVGHVHEGVQLLRLLPRQDVGLDPEDLAKGVESLVLF